MRTTRSLNDIYVSVSIAKAASWKPGLWWSFESTVDDVLIETVCHPSSSVIIEQRSAKATRMLEQMLKPFSQAFATGLPLSDYQPSCNVKLNLPSTLLVSRLHNFLVLHSCQQRTFPMCFFSTLLFCLFLQNRLMTLCFRMKKELWATSVRGVNWWAYYLQGIYWI